MEQNREENSVKDTTNTNIHNTENLNMKQIIIARRDLGMSPGKLAAQVSHASMAFLTSAIRQNASKSEDKEDTYSAIVEIDSDTYEEWILGAFTKVVLGAKQKGQLDKAKRLAEAQGMIENRDFFIICDSCRTELTPEEVDKSGNKFTPTCIGFRPMPEEMIDPIAKKFQLFR